MRTQETRASKLKDYMKKRDQLKEDWRKFFELKKSLRKRQAEVNRLAAELLSGE